MGAPRVPDPHSSLSELSTLSTQLDELSKRITAVADAYSDSPDSRVASDLFAAERSLHAVKRALNRASETLL
ncbi:MAG: hypothetical protein HYU28_04395, partial [Actinobacteria bacterium]|nr:hypothetical protein [Actinomycetota bacterium]